MKQSVQSYLEGDPAVAVFVDDIEHFLHEDRVGPHAEGTREFALGKRCAHHRDDLPGVTVFGSSPSFAGP